MGRPSKLEIDPAVTARLCELIEQPMPATHAAAMAGLSETTYFRWMASGLDPAAAPEYREFREAVARAKAVAAEKLLATVLRNAEGTIRSRSGLHSHESWLESDPASARWLLERMFPEEFGNRSKVEHSGPAGAPIDFTYTTSEAAQTAARAFIDAMSEDA